jgi:hypothetical protein
VLFFSLSPFLALSLFFCTFLLRQRSLDGIICRKPREEGSLAIALLVYGSVVEHALLCAWPTNQPTSHVIRQEGEKKCNRGLFSFLAA